MNTAWRLHQRRLWPRWVAMCLLLLALAACDKPGAPAPSTLVEGQAFPSFMLDFIAGTDGERQSLAGKTVVLNIWATWCAPCRREMPDLERLSKTLDPARFVVLGLSTDRDALLASEFLTRHRITFANYFDPDGTVSRQLGLRVYPATFVIAPNRILLRRLTGWHDWNSPDMLGLLEALDRAQTRP
ncbi:TlpA family protein disulfide reductase [Rhodoferax sp.]|uniref:TlpA family protein disulfide reductase n=1 Tax=Rhodoferax sp. TaxID=50421 RepID=UPI00275A770A|nr:TlpA disulfide reductase family protein [Rhodoferax sp.]